jgi:hypothetical protein
VQLIPADVPEMGTFCEAVSVPSASAASTLFASHVDAVLKQLASLGMSSKPASGHVQPGGSSEKRPSVAEVCVAEVCVAEVCVAVSVVVEVCVAVSVVVEVCVVVKYPGQRY